MITSRRVRLLLGWQESYSGQRVLLLSNQLKKEKVHLKKSARTSQERILEFHSRKTVTNPDDPTGRQSITRTGLAVLSARDPKPLLTYYKRISFLVSRLTLIVIDIQTLILNDHLYGSRGINRLDRSTSKPTLVEVELPRPTYIPKEKWGSEPNFKNRPLSITSSICLDFAFPSPFESLEGRPGSYSCTCTHMGTHSRKCHVASSQTASR